MKIGPSDCYKHNSFVKTNLFLFFIIFFRFSFFSITPIRSWFVELFAFLFRSTFPETWSFCSGCSWFDFYLFRFFFHYRPALIWIWIITFELLKWDLPSFSGWLLAEVSLESDFGSLSVSWLFYGSIEVKRDSRTGQTEQIFPMPWKKRIPV